MKCTIRIPVVLGLGFRGSVQCAIRIPVVKGHIGFTGFRDLGLWVWRYSGTVLGLRASEF